MPSLQRLAMKVHFPHRNSWDCLFTIKSTTMNECKVGAVRQTNKNGSLENISVTQDCAVGDLLLLCET